MSQPRPTELRYDRAGGERVGTAAFGSQEDAPAARSFRGDARQRRLLMLVRRLSVMPADPSRRRTDRSDPGRIWSGAAAFFRDPSRFGATQPDSARSSAIRRESGRPGPSADISPSPTDDGLGSSGTFRVFPGVDRELLGPTAVRRGTLEPRVTPRHRWAARAVLAAPRRPRGISGVIITPNSAANGAAARGSSGGRLYCTKRANWRRCDRPAPRATRPDPAMTGCRCAALMNAVPAAIYMLMQQSC